MATFPTTIDEVSAPWLTQTLRSAGVLDGSVSGFDAEPIGVGVGIMGLLHRLHLRCDGDGPATVVLKLPADGPEARHVAGVFRFYEKEVGFYRDFAQRTPVTTTDCFIASHAPETDDFVLLLADITDANVYSQIEGCPPEIAHVAARTLARHHATFLDSPLFDRPEHSWLPFGYDPPTPQGVMQGVTDAWEPFKAKFPEHVTPELEAIVARYPQSVPELLTMEAGRPTTLGHGDYRLDNLFFHDDGDVTVIDWQLCTKAPLAYDLAYFLTQSLTVEDRRAHETAIIDTYFEQLTASGGHHDRDDFMQDYRATAMFCLCYPLQSGTVELVNDRARELVSDMFVRAMSAIEDHDATEFLVD